MWLLRDVFVRALCPQISHVKSVVGVGEWVALRLRIELGEEVGVVGRKGVGGREGVVSYLSCVIA